MKIQVEDIQPKYAALNIDENEMYRTFNMGIGLVKRTLIINEPKWFFVVARETFEGFAGIVLAISFIVLVVAISKVYRSSTA